MASNIPFVRGLNVMLKLYQSGAAVYFPCKVWDVEENSTEVSDDVNGEDRSRLDKVLNYYSISLDSFQFDETQMNMILAAQAADDAQGLPLAQTCAIMINHRDGTRAAYVLSQCKFGPFKNSAQSRQDAYMMNLKIRFRYLKQVPSI